MARSREEYLAAKREGMARQRARDPEAARQKQRDWHSRNRERSRAKLRAYYGRRFFWGRAMKLRGDDRASALDLARLWRNQRGLCALTGRVLTRETAHLDHIKPLASGRNDHPSNLRWVCHEANLAKRALSDDQFYGLCRDVVTHVPPAMRWIGQRIQRVEAL